MGLAAVPPGELAAVVTYLEMTRRPRPAATPVSTLQLERWRKPSADRYRALFRRVGAPWLWYSRLAMDDGSLLTIIGDPGVEIHAVTERGIEVGLLELDLRKAGECELAYVGLVPELAGKGHGRWLLAQALALAWRPGVDRVHVHTCTLDHPAALPAYRRAGFEVVARAVETFPDPRASGLLAASDAPQVVALRRR